MRAATIEVRPRHLMRSGVSSLFRDPVFVSMLDGRRARTRDAASALQGSGYERTGLRTRCNLVVRTPVHRLYGVATLFVRFLGEL